MTATAVLALIAAVLALAAASVAALSISKRRKESSRPTDWDDLESARQTFIRPRMSDVWATGLMLASAVVGFVAAAHG
ncbi:hypothetical protein [Streptomyces mirabilis]|uniref:hypothetical protein n=1 Tax=Streptomyces mirabilis TaxID=68239 RepID=UPI0033D74649